MFPENRSEFFEDCFVDDPDLETADIIGQ